MKTENYLPSVCLLEVKINLLALEVVVIAHERWSLTRDSKYGDLTWKLLVFGNLAWEVRIWGLGQTRRRPHVPCPVSQAPSPKLPYPIPQCPHPIPVLVTASATGQLTNSLAYSIFLESTENCILQFQSKNQVLFVYHVLESLCHTSASPCTSPSPDFFMSYILSPDVPAFLRPCIPHSWVPCALSQCPHPHPTFSHSPFCKTGIEDKWSLTRGGRNWRFDC